MSRNQSLDALRGFAIFTMILSGSIAFNGVLPNWMYHAQVPPMQKFNPLIAGITWVDLVFPFFLFSMGAAIPLSLQKETNTTDVVLKSLKRFALLAFFALFFNHLKAWVIAEHPSAKEYAISIASFLLLILLLVKIKDNTTNWIVKGFALIVSVFLLYFLPFHKGKGFDFYKSDIIIMVLANMALFGTLIYWATKNNPMLRLAVLPIILAFFLAAKEPNNSWTKAIFQWKNIGEINIDWLYKFYFLKYLFIIIPGTFIGECLLRYNRSSKMLIKAKSTTSAMLGIVIIIFYIIFINLYCLYNRYLLFNLMATITLLFLLYYVISKHYNNSLFLEIFKIGAYLLMLGLCFEAYEGGIKKDSSTYSYYFVTSGLACFSILFFDVLQHLKIAKPIVDFLSNVGKNPLLAYMMGALCILPTLHLTGLFSYWDSLQSNAFLGFMKGFIFTLLVCFITNIFTKYKVILKT